MNIFDRLRSGQTTATAEETQEMAGRFGRYLPVDATLALSGDLGSGKTTFVRGLARSFGIHHPITSPSFTLVNIHRGDRTLVHVDAYRLEEPADLESLMIEDFLHSPYCLCVEWPEHVGNWLPPGTLTLRLELLEGGRHSIRLL